MKNYDLDVLVIADKGLYANMAFPTHSTWLQANGEIMTLQNLRRKFREEAGIPAAQDRHRPVSLTHTAKLNGLCLFEVCRRAGLDVALCNGHGMAHPDFRRLAAMRPRCVAISTTWMFGAQEAAQAVRDVRAAFPDAYLVVGGSLVFNSWCALRSLTLQGPADPARDFYLFLRSQDVLCPEADLFVVHEQGEALLPAIAQRLKNGEDPRGLANCAWYEDGRLRFSSRENMPADLSKHEVHWDELPDEWVPEIAPIRTSVGCPHRCVFCDFSPHRQFRVKGWEVLRTELLRVKRRRDRIRFLRFVDDTMTATQLTTLCRLLLDLKMDLPWTTFARADAVTAENARLLHESGCQSLQVGLESGDDGVLRCMNKRETAAQYLNALGWLNQAGVNVRASFIAGHPGETEETVENTLSFLEQVPTDGAGLFEYLVAPFLLLPLSPVNRPDQRRRYGLEGFLGQWRHNTMTSSDVPKHVTRLLTGPRNDVFVCYTDDDLMPDIPARSLKRIKAVRQRLQRLEITGGQEQDKRAAWEALASLFAPLCPSARDGAVAAKTAGATRGHPGRSCWDYSERRQLQEA